MGTFSNSDWPSLQVSWIQSAFPHLSRKDTLLPPYEDFNFAAQQLRVEEKIRIKYQRKQVDGALLIQNSKRNKNKSYLRHTEANTWAPFILSLSKIATLQLPQHHNSKIPTRGCVLGAPYFPRPWSIITNAIIKIKFNKATDFVKAGWFSTTRDGKSMSG